MRIVLAGDHAGVTIRDALSEAIASLGHEPVHVGPCGDEPVDYPVAAGALCREIMSGRAQRGVLLCGSGAGMTVAANRFPGIRAANAHDTYTAHQMVEHDAVNVLTMGSRVIDEALAVEIVREFVSASFQPVDRYRRRLAQVIEIERSRSMNPLTQLSAAGQAVWLDYIRRDILDDGTLARYTVDCAVTGLTSNPAIFDKAISGTDLYDDAIQGTDSESVFFDLAIDDLTRAADILRTAWDATDGMDGCVSLEVSPLLADDAQGTIEQGEALFKRMDRPNLLIKVPGTEAGAEAIEELIFRGVNVNVTLLFDEAQYRRAAEAYIRGIRRRIEAGLDPHVFSVASVFVSRWDTPTAGKVGPDLANRLGIACAVQCHRASIDLFGEEFAALAAKGARPQILLMASTSTKDPSLPDTMYVEGLAAKDTINTIPEATLLAFADHGNVGSLLGPDDWADADRVIAGFEDAGIDTSNLARQLQDEGAQSFVDAWNHLLKSIATKIGQLQTN